jgi:hypothetical protein
MIGPSALLIKFPTPRKVHQSFSNYDRQDVLDAFLLAAVCASVYQIMRHVSLFSTQESTALIPLGHASSFCLVLTICFGMVTGHIYVVYNVGIWQLREILELVLLGEIQSNTDDFDIVDFDGSENSQLASCDGRRWRDEIHGSIKVDGWMHRLDGRTRGIFREHSGCGAKFASHPNSADPPFLVSTFTSVNFWYNDLSDLSEDVAEDSHNPVMLVSEDSRDGDGSTARLGRRLDEIEQELLTDSLEAFHESLKGAFERLCPVTR